MYKTATYMSLIFLLMLLPGHIIAQNYFGVWEGNNDYSFGWVHPQKVVLELYKETDSTVSGASHLYYANNKYEHYIVTGTINLKDQTIKVSEVSTLSVKIGFLMINSLGTYYLSLACSDTICTLKGKWKPRGFALAAGSVNTHFKKRILKPGPQIATPVDTTIKVEMPAVLQRQSDIQSLIEIDKDKNDSINIKIYDNGEIDQDSVSLYLDDSLLLYRQKISLTPLVINIPISKINSISKLKLIAESLGTIPPCTAVMVVSIGKKRYEISLSSSFEKNAVVELFVK